MSLKDISLKRSYDSDDDDILNDFYIPALSESVEYNRLTGYFSSTALAVAAKGIGELIKNNGKMKLITGFFSKKDDIDAARNAIENPEKTIAEIDRIIKGEKLEELFIRESIKALAWMLVQGYLEIKVALIRKDELDKTEFIFHPKIGVIKDEQGNKISFEGSINETGIAWLKNYESFKVFKSWEPNQKDFFEPDNTRFVKLWNNLAEKVEVVPLPEAIQNKLIQIGKNNADEINFKILEGKIFSHRQKKYKKKEEIKLREYQIPAFTNWVNNEHKGIIEMATGTGKTYVGIAGLQHYLDQQDKGIAIICTPRHEICQQWIKKIKATTGYDSLIFIGGGKNKWISQASNILHDYTKDRKKRIVFVSTYDSLKDILRLIRKSEISGLFLLADEVHSFGAKKRRQIIDDPTTTKLVSHRMGLSATPERKYDEVGNEVINNFFKKTVYRYSLGEAINDGVLCPYEYHVSLVEMIDEEFDEYFSYTTKIAKAYHANSASQLYDEDNEYLSALLNKRANIIKAARNKFKAVDTIIKKLITNNDISNTFIFCINTKQKNFVTDILDDYPRILYSQITGAENQHQRRKILDEFKDNRIHMLLSMKILDEGIDISAAKNAIVLSSSTNPREYIQRRGRVLRKTPNQEKLAKIYDFIVVPSIEEKFYNELFDLERNILKKELTRAFYFAKHANNKLDIIQNIKLTNLIERYKLGELYENLTNAENQ